MRKYAGIGSRDTPPNILGDMAHIGWVLCHRGYMLRSGRAKGADSAFESYVPQHAKEIFLASQSDDHPDWYIIAERFHPAWCNCTAYAKQLHARNSPIILGKNLDDPVDFVVCWTKGGKASGGTGQGLKIAKSYNIPIFNLHNAADYQRLKDFVEQ